jgi:hypothetical protein
MPRLFFPRLLGNRGVGSSLPSTPTLSASRLSATSALVSITADTGTSSPVYYLQLGSVVPVTGPTINDSGSATITGLTAGATYLFYTASSNGASYSFPVYTFLSLTASDTILAAVLSQWQGSPTLLALGGTLFANEVPETLGATPVTPPYAVAVVGKSSFDWTTEKSYVEYAQVRLCCYALGAANAEAVASELHARFDWQSLPFLTATALYCRPADYQVSSSFVRYRTGEIIYNVDVVYDVAVLRNLGTG